MWFFVAGYLANFTILHLVKVCISFFLVLVSFAEAPSQSFLNLDFLKFKVSELSWEDNFLTLGS